MLANDAIELALQSTAGIRPRGGTIIGTSLEDALREPKLLDSRLYETAELFFG